jgi:hypothetical protein
MTTSTDAVTAEQKQHIAGIVHRDCTLMGGATFYNAAELAIEATLAQLSRAPTAVQAAQVEGMRVDDGFERALTELVNKIDTGLDSGDLLTDARRASAAIDSILSCGDLVACAHKYFHDSGDRYEKSIEFRIGWNACLDAIGVARAALAAPAASAGDQV